MKRLFYLASLLAIAVGCNKVESPAPELAKTFKLNSEIAQTKVAVDDQGLMTWQKNDEISLLSESNAFPISLTSGEGTSTGIFSGSIEGTPYAAVYPAGDHSARVDGYTIVDLPDSYQYTAAVTNAPMLAEVTSDEELSNGTAVFHHIGALVRVSYKNVPAEAKTFTLTSDANIAGKFPTNYKDEEPIISVNNNIVPAKSVTINFEAVQNEMSFYVPLPCGEYGFSVALNDADGNPIEGSSKSVTSVKVDRKAFFKTPMIELEGEESKHTIVAKEVEWTTTDGVFSGSADGFTISAVKNNGSTAPTYNTNGKDVRVYAKGTVTIESKDPMTKIVFNISTQGLQRLAPITPSVGDVKEQTKGDKTVEWTGSATSVSFTVGETGIYGIEDTKAGQLLFTSIDITTFGAPVKDVNVNGIILDQTSATLQAGKTLTLTATVTPDQASNKRVTWISSDETVATVSNGIVTGLSEGNTVITATTEDGEFTATCSIKVATPVYSSLEELVADDIISGATVTVSFKDIAIKSFYTSGSYRNGVLFDIQKDKKDIEIFYWNVPEEWIVGGTLSGTMTCPWKLYSGTWELAPEKDSWSWDSLTYTAPKAQCATPVITIDEDGNATITCDTEGATIYYTVGTTPADPTNTSDQYTEPIAMQEGETIKAIACKNDMTNSEVASKKYTSVIEYKLTIQTSNFNTTSYAANNGSHDYTATCTSDATKTITVSCMTNQVMQNSSAMQWQKSAGYIYNTTDLGTITSVTVDSTAGTFTTYYGTSEHPTSGTTVGNGFFTVAVGGATGKTSSVVVTFIPKE